MSHFTSIGAGIYSDLSIAVPTVPPVFNTLEAQADFDDLFATEIQSQGGVKGAATFVRVKNVREFPPIGTPPNVINVPVYGQKQSQQVQGQSDAPSIELTLNFVSSDWAAGSILGDMVGDGMRYVLRFSLLNSEPKTVGPTKYASDATGIGTVENSLYYWIGKVEALLVNPQLTDANTATVTMSIQSDFFGAFTCGV